MTLIKSEAWSLIYKYSVFIILSKMREIVMLSTATIIFPVIANSRLKCQLIKSNTLFLSIQQFPFEPYLKKATYTTSGKTFQFL